jgi:transposase
MNATEARFVAELQSENVSLKKELEKRDQQIVNLQGQLDWLKRQIFGKRSERVVESLNEEQLTFEGFDSLPTKESEKKPEKPPKTRKKPNRDGRDKITLPSDLPVKTTIIDIPEEEKTCSETGIPLVKIGEEVTLKLAHEPGSFYIKEIIRLKYAHPEREENGVKTAELPDSLLSRCKADESFLAEIITRKFADHLPLYRIAENLSREGIGISRKLLSQWVIRCGLALKPIYEVMTKQVLDSGNIFIDETPLKLQDIGKCKQAYMWVTVGGNESDPPYRIYSFKENRRHGNVLDILKDYKGGLHSDKYGAYQSLAERKIITWYPCWSHIRRKFFEAEVGDIPFRQWVLRKIRHLFMLEKVAWARSPEERLKIRQEKEAPIIDELIEKIKLKLVDGGILPKSKFREALGYFCGLIPYLKNYTQHAFARLDNNVAERALRPLTIGRKNWLFVGTPESGEAAGILFSLVQTCRALNINPREFLEDVMRRIMGHSNQKLHELLPDQWLSTRQQNLQST